MFYPKFFWFWFWFCRRSYGWCWEASKLFCHHSPVCHAPREERASVFSHLTPTQSSDPTSGVTSMGTHSLTFHTRPKCPKYIMTLLCSSFHKCQFTYIFLVIWFLCFPFFFSLFMAAPAAYGGSKARGHIGDTGASLCHSHGNSNL